VIGKSKNKGKLSKDQLHRFLTQRAGIHASKASLVWCDEAIELLKNAH